MNSIIWISRCFTVNSKVTCTPPWKKVHRGCYMFNRHLSTWYDAQQVCQRNGGYLASMSSRAEAVRSILRTLQSNYHSMSSAYHVICSNFNKENCFEECRYYIWCYVTDYTERDRKREIERGRERENRCYLTAVITISSYKHHL